MNYITDTLDFSLEKRSVITLGKFDGFHKGHQKLIKRIREIGKDGYETVIFTFDVSPAARLGKGTDQMLLTPAERVSFAHDLGVDCMVVCPFTDEVRSMEPEQFVREILVEKLKAKYLVVGDDFHFGYQRKGTPQLLEQLGRVYGFTVEIVAKETHCGRPISSSWVREALASGDMRLVSDLLGYEYSFEGAIIHGKKLGRKLGFPTINQIPDARKLYPPFGVYSSRVWIRGKEYKGISNLGCKPTVDGSFVGLETYLYDCDEDLYAAIAKTELLFQTRPEKKFNDVEELRRQLQQDIESGKEYHMSKTFD